VSLPDGIELIGEWVGRLRELLGAMGATELLPYPEGRSPTPTYPNPTTLSGAEAKAVERMRQAIREAPKGKTARADGLIQDAGINRKRGRDALRRLQAHGEYAGFARDRHRRYADGHPQDS
jgi:hypothetical protein